VKVVFTDLAWSHYLHWQETDRKMLARVNAVIKECLRSPFEGTGRPEPLRSNLSGWWSRRIDQEHRLVYKIEGDNLVITQCRFHYQ
jgi:toxin YoeB